MTHSPFDTNNYRARATNARKMPLYVGHSADGLRIILARIVGAAAFVIPLAVLVAVWLRP